LNLFAFQFQRVMAVVGGSHSWTTQDVTGLKH